MYVIIHGVVVVSVAPKKNWVIFDEYWRTAYMGFLKPTIIEQKQKLSKVVVSTHLKNISQIGSFPQVE